MFNYDEILEAMEKQDPDMMKKGVYMLGTVLTNFPPLEPELTWSEKKCFFHQWAELYLENFIYVLKVECDLRDEYDLKYYIRGDKFEYSVFLEVMEKQDPDKMRKESFMLGLEQNFHQWAELFLESFLWVLKGQYDLRDEYNLPDYIRVLGGPA